jgi:hypothetical protein
MYICTFPSCTISIKQTLYLIMQSMGDDIREIETQNRALQIFNSNQHSLISELDGLLVKKKKKK